MIVNVGLLIGLSFALVIAGGAAGAVVALWMSGRYFDQGYRTGLTDRRPEPQPTVRAFRLPRRTR